MNLFLKAQNAVHNESSWSEHGNQMTTNGKEAPLEERESAGLGLLAGYRGGTVTHLLGWWSALQSRTQIGLVFATSTVAFLVLNFYSLPVVGAALRLVTGLIAIVLVPGGTVAAAFLGREMRNLGVSASLGLGLALVECQVSLTIALTSGLHLPLIYFLCVSSSAIVLTCLAITGRESLQGFFRLSFLYEKDARLLKVLVLALALRLTLAFLALDSISPDSALFADYARSMLVGEFESNVSNELAVLSLWDSANYVIHQAFAYVLAVSWLLFPPISVGPIMLLPLVGTVLIIPTYSITKHLFTEKAAIVIAAIMAISPLFVFHSAVGYGPEITSLLFLTYGMIFLVGPQKSERACAMMAGFFIGLVDAIWYANFYAFCVMTPILLHHFRGYTRFQTLTNAFLFALILLAKLLFRNLLVFFSCWTVVFVVILLLRIRRPESGSDSLLLFFIGTLASLVLWLWPLQVAAIGIPSSATRTEAPLISAILAPISLDVIARFALFYAFHLTIPILCLLVLALFKGVNRRAAQILVLCTLIDAAGTLKIFSLISGSMEAIYIYSDSRFFLFFAFGAFVAIGAYFASSWSELRSDSPVDVSRLPGLQRRRLVLLAVVIGCVPGYILFPLGTDLVNVDARYGWNGLSEEVGHLGNADTVFIVDNGREFSWVTGRNSAILTFTQVGLSFSNASKELVALAHEFNASYVLVDPYTIAHWATFSELLQYAIPIGSSVPLCTNITSILEGQNDTGPTLSLKLVAETQPNNLGRFARIFEFENPSYTRVWDVDLLSPGWSASNGGAIVNSTGYPELVIGNLQDYTNTWRPALFDLNLSVEAGFLFCRISNVSARVARIEVWNSAGSFVCYAQGAGTGQYCCPLNNVTIGDIRVVIEGNPGGSVVISSMSLWNTEGV